MQVRKIFKKLPERIKNPLRRIRRGILFAKREVLKRILTRIKAREVLASIKKNKVILVYDNICSPPTYGDFLYVMFLAQYIRSHGVDLLMVLTKGDYRDDWNPLHTQGKTEWFLHEQLSVARFILGESANIKTMDWAEFEKEVMNSTERHLVLFSNYIFSRKRIYHFCFNVTNILISKAPQEQIKCTLLRCNELHEKYITGRVHDKSPPENYISLACRRNEIWGQDRNLSDTDFKALILTISKSRPDMPIVIISDALGCNYFKALVRDELVDLSQKILFSKDYTNSFLEDLSLALKSKAYIQLVGGGMSSPIWFSDTPYFIVQRLAHEFMWKRNSLTSWSNSSQVFINETRIDLMRLNKFLKKI